MLSFGNVSIWRKIQWTHLEPGRTSIHLNYCQCSFFLNRRVFGGALHAAGTLITATAFDYEEENQTPELLRNLLDASHKLDATIFSQCRFITVILVSPQVRFFFLPERSEFGTVILCRYLSMFPKAPPMKALAITSLPPFWSTATTAFASAAIWGWRSVLFLDPQE